MKNSLKLAPIDLAILGVIQLLQPVNAQEAYLSSVGTEIHEVLNQKEFTDRLKQLLKAKLLWKTGRHDFGVMPRGTKLAELSVSPEKRDKVRFLTLNRRFRR